MDPEPDRDPFHFRLLLSRQVAFFNGRLKRPRNHGSPFIDRLTPHSEMTGTLKPFSGCQPICCCRPNSVHCLKGPSFQAKTYLRLSQLLRQALQQYARHGAQACGI